MFGERYFATRERLSDVMHGIAELATETGTELGDRLPFAEMAKGLGTPLLFVVCGEVNAGKSTLINGLFGRDLCRVNILPETDRVLWYRYGNPARDVEITPVLDERYRPIEFLRDFNLIDTPGTNSVIKDHQAITEKFLPTADLILFVFPVTNPWGAATWDLISRMQPEAMERMTFIVQQADQREPIDITVILGHMADLSMKRIGRVPPIFAVSGKLAYEAKRTKPFAPDLLKKSGYPALENFISKSVCESPARKQTLEVWRSQAASALRAASSTAASSTAVPAPATRELSAAGIPVTAMTAPMIPALNDPELESLLEAAADAGAKRAGYVLLRLPLEIAGLFTEWLEANYPDRAKKVMSLLRSAHNGQDYRSEWKVRGRGDGPYAELIAARFRNAVKRLGLNTSRFELRTDLFRVPPRTDPGSQMSLL